jgi:amidase
MPHFGQELLQAAQALGGLDDADYAAAAANTSETLRGALERAFAAHDLDALVAPANGPAWRTDWSNGDRLAVSSSYIAAISGYPSVAVPATLSGELPLGVAFIGKPYGEAPLIEIAAVFERSRGVFPKPKYLASIGD